MINPQEAYNEYMCARVYVGKMLGFFPMSEFMYEISLPCREVYEMFAVKQVLTLSYIRRAAVFFSKIMHDRLHNALRRRPNLPDTLLVNINNICL